MPAIEKQNTAPYVMNDSCVIEIQIFLMRRITFH